MENRGSLIVVSGFAGAGKSSLVQELVNNYDNYVESISMTTRGPRNKEKDCVDYFFTDQETFKQKIKEEAFIEHASYCDNYYGTLRDHVEKQLDADKDVILVIEYQGAIQVKEKMPDALFLFVMPPSAKILYERLVGRNTETKEVIKQRMLRAVEESGGIEQYDYILVNDDLQVCMREMHQLIQSEKYRVDRNAKIIKDIRQELSDLTKGDL
ncbi:MAG: guanylate kinase [Lachnospiraceae bacterium]